MSMTQSHDSTPHCVACGYNLYGLGDGPRCPECGLKNAPDGLRRQVWDYIDTRPTFISSFFNPFAKRLPGWWWALDREGDVGRSIRFAIRNLCLSVVITLAALMLATQWEIKMTFHWAVFDSSKSVAPPVFEEECGYSQRTLFGVQAISNCQFTEWRQLKGPSYSLKETISSEVLFKPSSKDIVTALGFALSLTTWAGLIWAIPGYVGLCTQIRRELRPISRAPRTIVAAINFESHRILYVSLLFSISILMATVIQLRRANIPFPQVHFDFFLFAIMVTLLYAALGWVGPLRSDYTGLLVRSRLHMCRIVFMYALVLPASFAFALFFLMAILQMS